MTPRADGQIGRAFFNSALQVDAQKQGWARRYFLLSATACRLMSWNAQDSVI
jgi:hypothetical protein